MRRKLTQRRRGAKRSSSFLLFAPLRLCVSFFFLFAFVVKPLFPAPPEAPGSVRDVVYFGPSGPVRLRFHIAIGGRPADAVWAEAIDALFAFCDRNGDGVLDERERAVFAPPRRGRNDVVVFDQMSGTPPLQLTFDRKQETVTRAAFAAAVRAASQEPVRLTLAAGRADAPRLSTALFKHLDRDGDGKLSADELRAARERLAAFDVNEDEYLSAAELLGRAVTANASRFSGGLGEAAPDEPSASSPDLVFLAPDGGEAVKQLLAARGNGRAASLGRKEFGADEATFAAVDTDKNGRLDAAELGAWLRLPADVEFVLAFGPGGEPLTHTLSPWNANVARRVQVRTEPGGEVIVVPGARLRFEPPGDRTTNPRAAWDQTAARLREQFKQLAKDAGAVERKALENQPALLALLDFADRNGDGKLDAAEVESALKVLAPLASCRVVVTFVDEGDGLFELLDRNGDGRLSPRELVEAVAVLKPFAGAGGAVGPKDLPRRFPVRAAAAPVPLVVPSAPAGRMAAAMPDRPAPRTDVPAWFLKMDRNGDGDVSLREFLGPVELFRKLDRDGDGLISAAESRRADK